MSKNYKEVTACRCCGSEKLTDVLDLGNQPLANSFHDNPKQKLQMYPLKVNLCTECYHLQLSIVVNPDLMFKDYLYVSGTTKTLKKYFDFFAYWAIERYKAYNKGAFPSTVLDIACNDGSLLDSFRDNGVITTGVDPAENLYSISAGQKKHTVMCEYLNDNTLAGNEFDIIVAQNVLAHVDDVVGFLKNCRRLLKPKGVLLVQTSQADMVINTEWDTIYHEHLSYFNTNSMNMAVSNAALCLNNVQKFSIHGNSYVFEIAKHLTGTGNAVMEMQGEQLRGLYNVGVYQTWGNLCYLLISKPKDYLTNYLMDGYKIIGYGAAAKGMTVLGSLGVPQRWFEYIIDDNPMKQGLYTPVGNIPIYSIDKLKEEPDKKILFVPLAWNFFAEIRSRIKQIRNNDNDLFLNYFPQLEITN